MDPKQRPNAEKIMSKCTKNNVQMDPKQRPKSTKYSVQMHQKFMSKWTHSNVHMHESHCANEGPLGGPHTYKEGGPKHDRATP